MARASRKRPHTQRFHEQKSDSRIVFLGLIILVIAIAGAAALFFGSVYSSRTGPALEVTGATCGSEGATIYLKNIGTRNVSFASIAVSKRVLAGLAPGTLRVVPGFSTLAPQAGGAVTDIDCALTLHPGAVCEYTLSAGGAPVKTQVAC